METATHPAVPSSTTPPTRPPRPFAPVLAPPLALAVAAAALALGVLGDALLRSTPWGLGAALWLAALGAATVFASRRAGAPAFAGRRALLPLLPVLLAAGGLAWRDSPALKALDLLAALLALAWLGVRATDLTGRADRRLHRDGIADYGLGAATAGLHALGGAAPLLGAEVPWRRLTGHDGATAAWRRHAAAVGRGLALAAAPLILFGALLAAGDAVFADLLGRALGWNPVPLFPHLALTLLLAWPAAGFLRAAACDAAAPRPDLRRPPWLRLGTVEVGVLLGALDTLFAAFVLVQARYLFGGAARVEVSTTLTYAAYARRGFFELVAVAALALPLLLLVHWLLPGNGADGATGHGARTDGAVKNDSERTDRRSPAARRVPAGPAAPVFRLLAGAQVALLGVVLASALRRMRLYQQEYGLTELRLYTTAFMAWLAVVFVWFVLTVLRDRQHRFAAGALLAAALVLAALHIANPDALIVRANAALAAQPDGRPFDHAYARSLGADAVPALVAALPALPDPERCLVAKDLLARWRNDGGDWRTWSWGRAEAHRAVRGMEAPPPACAPAWGTPPDRERRST